MMKTTKMRHALMLIMTCVVGANMGMVEVGASAPSSAETSAISPPPVVTSATLQTPVDALMQLLGNFSRDDVHTTQSELAKAYNDLQLFDPQASKLPLMLWDVLNTKISPQLFPDNCEIVARILQLTRNAMSNFDEKQMPSVSLKHDVLHEVLDTIASQVTEPMRHNIDRLARIYKAAAQAFDAANYSDRVTYNGEFMHIQEVCCFIYNEEPNHGNKAGHIKNKFALLIQAAKRTESHSGARASGEASTVAPMLKNSSIIMQILAEINNLFHKITKEGYSPLLELGRDIDRCLAGVVARLTNPSEGDLPITAWQKKFEPFALEMLGAIERQDPENIRSALDEAMKALNSIKNTR